MNILIVLEDIIITKEPTERKLILCNKTLQKILILQLLLFFSKICVLILRNLYKLFYFNENF